MLNLQIHLVKEGIGALQISHLDIIDIKPLQFGAPGSNGHVQALAGDVHLSTRQKEWAKRGALLFFS